MSSVGLVSGPTGGHLLPALLVSRELLSRGVDVSLYTSSSDVLDRFALPDLSVVEMSVYPWSGESLLGKLKSIVSVGREYFRLRNRIRSHQALISFGGYPAVSGLLVAWEAGMDVYFQEQNRILGRTHGLFSGIERMTFFGFPPKQQDSVDKFRVTGNPVRPPGNRDDSWFETDSLLVVFGGSQGSREVSTRLLKAGKGLLESGWSIYYVTGDFGRDLTAEDWSDSERFRQVEFDRDLHEVLPLARCVWSRAGAGTLSELITYDVPGLVFPYPHSTDDHQRANALWVSERGPVDVVESESDLSADQLVERTEALGTSDRGYTVPWDRDRLPQEIIAGMVQP